MSDENTAAPPTGLYAERFDEQVAALAVLASRSGRRDAQ